MVAYSPVEFGLSSTCLPFTSLAALLRTAAVFSLRAITPLAVDSSLVTPSVTMP
ncbi:hypothetical protein D9M69_658710 [compost metagenome]